MNLQDFLWKWDGDRNQLPSLITAAFEIDPRTFTRWKRSTPRHTQIALGLLDRTWEREGKQLDLLWEL